MSTKVQLVAGDCLEVLPGLADGSVDLVVTSPPYNLGVDYASYDDGGQRTNFLDWCLAWCRELRRVLGDGGSLFLNLGAAPSNPLLPHQLLLALCDGDQPLFVLQNTFHWIKSITVETREGRHVSAGHFKPINSKRFVNDCHEFVFHLTRQGDVPLDRRAAGVPYVHKSNIARWAHTGGADLRCRGNAWFLPYDTIRSRDDQRPHPATFPVGLPERCILIHGLGARTRMLDPFLGIGSSAVAAVRRGIAAFTGIELDPSYLAVARERVDEVVSPGQPDLFP